MNELLQKELGKLLCEAATVGDLTMVKRLLLRGVDANTRDMMTGGTPLHLAINHPFVTQTLLDSHANPGLTDNAGNIALHYAAQYGQFVTAAQLLKAGSDIHTENRQGHTPVDLAVSNQMADMALWLMRAEHAGLAIDDNMLGGAVLHMEKLEQTGVIAAALTPPLDIHAKALELLSATAEDARHQALQQAMSTGSTVESIVLLREVLQSATPAFAQDEVEIALEFAALSSHVHAIEPLVLAGGRMTPQVQACFEQAMAANLAADNGWMVQQLLRVNILTADNTWFKPQFDVNEVLLLAAQQCKVGIVHTLLESGVSANTQYQGVYPIPEAFIASTQPTNKVACYATMLDLFQFGATLKLQLTDLNHRSAVYNICGELGGCEQSWGPSQYQTGTLYADGEHDTHFPTQVFYAYMDHHGVSLDSIGAAGQITPSQGNLLSHLQTDIARTIEGSGLLPYLFANWRNGHTPFVLQKILPLGVDIYASQPQALCGLHTADTTVEDAMETIATLVCQFRGVLAGPRCIATMQDEMAHFMSCAGASKTEQSISCQQDASFTCLNEFWANNAAVDGVSSVLLGGGWQPHVAQAEC